MARGLFLSLDGLDGVGKSTQCRLLAQWLRQRGHVVTECSDPGGTQAGQVIRNLLLNHANDLSITCEALLFMASRAQLVAEVIRPALNAGQIVIADRFLLANVAYQGYGGGLDPATLYNIGLFATGGLEPDLTLVLDLPLAAAQARRTAEKDRIEIRDEAFHDRVRAGFRQEAARRPDRTAVIDAGRTLDEVQAAIRSRVEMVLKE